MRMFKSVLFLIVAILMSGTLQAQVGITLPDSVLSVQESEVMYPVYLENMSSDSILGYTMEFKYDPGILSISSFNSSSTLSSSFSAVGNNETDSTYVLSVAGANPIYTNGVLIYLVLTPSNPGESVIELIDIEINEGAIVPTISSGTVIFENIATSISNEKPKGFILEQNYPNPFNPVTRIKYTLPEASIVNFTVFDISGRKVFSKSNQAKSAGNHTINFDATRYPSGVYIYRISTGTFISTKKMTLIK